ncbi:AMP-binding protein [Muricoccus radiodurans]|uniref:AMP-binding protein n=1 Tax=Muricoccus radiodurans TaxID=2231721 RepID=UPI003CFAB077
MAEHGQERGPATLTALLEGRAAERPDAPAILADGAAPLAYRALAAAARRVAGGLAAQGIGPGDRVALWLPNRPAILVLQFALARLGAVAVHLSSRASAAELAALLGRARPSAIVTEWGFGVDFPGMLAEALADLRAPLRFVAGLGEGLPPRLDGLPVVPWAVLDGAAEAAADLATPEAAVLTFTTSGTTGTPKLALHAQASIAAHARDVSAALGLGEAGSVALVPVPLCGTFGLSLAMAALAGGAALVAPPRFEPAAADAAIRQHRVTHMVGGDDLLLRLAEAAGGQPYDSMRFTGFASFHPGAERVAEVCGALGMNPHGLYGASEVQAIFAVQDEVHRRLPGGRPVGRGAAVLADAEGVLSFRGPSLFCGYLGDPAATKAALADGTYTSSDLGEVRPDGGFTFLGRRDDALRLSGFLVQPAEIEAVLSAQPGVTAAIVVGARGGTAAVAFVQGGADPAALQAACEAALPRHKRPARIVALESLPVAEGPNGAKPQRRALREEADRILAEAPA